MNGVYILIWISSVFWLLPDCGIVISLTETNKKQNSQGSIAFFHRRLNKSNDPKEEPSLRHRSPIIRRIKVENRHKASDQGRNLNFFPTMNLINRMIQMKNQIPLYFHRYVRDFESYDPKTEWREGWRLDFFFHNRSKKSNDANEKPSSTIFPSLRNRFWEVRSKNETKRRLFSHHRSNQSSIDMARLLPMSPELAVRSTLPRMVIIPSEKYADRRRMSWQVTV